MKAKNIWRLVSSAALIAALAAQAGCGKGEVKKNGGDAVKEVKERTPVALAKAGISFKLAAPDEVAPGLTAVPVPASGEPSPEELLKKAWEGKAGRIVEGGDVVIVGRLPGALADKDFFSVESAVRVGPLIEAEVRIVRYQGDAATSPRAAYVLWKLPKLASDGYNATIRFKNYKHFGDGGEMKPVLPGVGKAVPPMNCDFKIEKAGK